MTTSSMPTRSDAALGVLDAVLHRQSVVTFKPECPPRELIEQLLQTAVTAPNHHLNQPWRFIVLAGKAREEYGEFLAERLRRMQSHPDSPQVARQMDAERAKPLRSPVVIVAAATRTEHAKAMRVEDVAATAAALEHVLLAAPAFGLGAYWRTGDPAYDPSVKKFFGLNEDDDIVGLLYVGYPEMTRPIRERAPATDKSTWRGWD